MATIYSGVNVFFGIFPSSFLPVSIGLVQRSPVRSLSHDLLVFRIGIALVVSLAHAATNQIYAICGAVLTREEIGTGMEIVGLGSGIFGYLGPQMLGYLRDSTGGFTAGWFFVALAAVVSLADLLVLRAWSSRVRAAAAG